MPSGRFNSPPAWLKAIIVAVVLIGWTWAHVSAPPEERDEIRGRCAGFHVLIGVRISGSFDGDDWSRRATYVCFPGGLSKPRQYGVESRNDRLIEVSSADVWWPYFFLALAVATAAWKGLSKRRRDS